MRFIGYLFLKDNTLNISPEELLELAKAIQAAHAKVEIDKSTAVVEPPESSLPILKVEQFAEEKMQAIEVMYCPPEYDDLHGERMSELEIRKMVDNFNENINNVQGNLGHIKNTKQFKPIKAWVNEVECMIGDNLVAEGTPLVKIQFYDQALFEARKSGKLKGLSIGALGRSVEKE